jgi:MFS family permease
MNKKIIWLILSDILILSSFGLIAPIFAIFINRQLAGTLVEVGIATTIFWVVKSVLQLPLSKYIDRHRHKQIFLIIGTFLIITVPFIYALSTSVYGIYFAQAVYGIGGALAYPAWYTLFVAYGDKKNRSFEWAWWSSGVGVGIAVSAYLGATLAELFGFKTLFFVVGGVALCGFLLLFFLFSQHMKSRHGAKH